MRHRYVIVAGLAGVLSIMVMFGDTTATESALKRKVDSLFVIASSGEVMYRDLVEPAMDSIAAIGEEAVPILIDKFATRSARERWTVIWILQRIGSPAVPYLVRALSRPDGLVVQRVCWALGDIGDTTAVMPLIGIIDHPRWQVREQAVRAVGKIGDRRAQDAVSDALTDPVGQVRKAAVVSCGLLTVSGAVRQLVHALGDGFYGARLAAVEALLRLDTASVMAALADSLASENRMVGDLACKVLGEIGGDAAIELLLAQTESPYAGRRAHAAVALIKADPADNCGYHQLLLDRETDRLTRLKIESALAALRNVTRQSP